MRNKRTIRLIITVCGVLAFVLLMDHLGLLQGPNRQVYDFFQRLRGPREPSNNIIVAAIDERTLEHLGRWPIDRKHYATLLDRLKSAEAVGIDIIMGEPSDSDGMLAEAMKRHGRVILPVYFDPEGQLMSPLASLTPAAVGHIHMEQDVDGITRRVVHTILYRGKAIPSFASAIHDTLPGKKISREALPSTAEHGPYPSFLDQADSMIINYYGPRESSRQVSFLDLLQGSWPDGFFRGKVVLVGLTAAGVEGEQFTPFTGEGTRMPGVEVHAHILNNLLDGTYYRCFETRWVWLAVGILGCLYLPLCAGRTPVRLAFIWSCSLLGGAAVIFSALVFLNTWIVPGPFLTLITVGSAVAYVATLQDMRASLLQSKKDWEESFDSIDDAIVIYGMDCQAEKHNRAASEKIGPSLSGSLEQMCSGFFLAEGSVESSRQCTLRDEDLTATLEEVYDQETKRHFEVRLIRRMDEKGRLSGLVQVLRDITGKKLSEKERDRLQSMLVQSQKMEAIGTLAAGVAHDFNNILAAVMGYTELALFAEGVTPRIKLNLEEVLKAGGRAKELVQQILNLSRQSQHELRPVAMPPLLKEVLQFLRASLPKTIEIRKDFRVDSAYTLSDPIQIHQILMNLCTNATHAMREKGGVLEVTLEALDLTAEDRKLYPDLTAGPYLKLSVADTGPGIEPSVKERVFDPYFTTKPPGEGTGMGLAVVRSIVKSHKGTITLYSEIGKGTVFHVLLPRITAAGEREEKAVEAIPGGRERILFVDDEETLAYLGKEVLERLGYEVVTMTSSRDALDLFAAEPGRFDLVVTDQTMPQMTGIVLAREILKLRADIPIVLCTGYSELVSREKAKQMGIRAFLLKPLLTRELAVAIRKAIDGSTG